MLPNRPRFFVFCSENALGYRYPLAMSNDEHIPANKPMFSEIEVQEYRKAFEEEFAEREATKAKPIKGLEDLEAPALEAISYTVKHSQNESLRTRTAQWVLDKLLDNANREEDKVLDFLKGLPVATPDPETVDH